MYLGKTLFAQIMDFLPWKAFHRIVDRYSGAPALIWLEAEEKTAYDQGERVFKAFTDTMKVQAI